MRPCVIAIVMWVLLSSSASAQPATQDWNGLDASNLSTVYVLEVIAERRFDWIGVGIDALLARHSTSERTVAASETV